MLARSCSEFLVHGVDVEGMQLGIDDELVLLLGQWAPIPVTYAGGARTLVRVCVCVRACVCERLRGAWHCLLLQAGAGCTAAGPGEVHPFGRVCSQGAPPTVAAPPAQADLERVRKAAQGRADNTVGSALDIFGGALPYADVLAWHRKQAAAAADAGAAAGLQQCADGSVMYRFD